MNEVEKKKDAMAREGILHGEGSEIMKLHKYFICKIK